MRKFFISSLIIFIITGLFFYVNNNHANLFRDKSFVSYDSVVRNSFAKCGKGNEKCYFDFLDSYVKINGVIKSQTLLAKYQEYNNLTNVPCHNLAHSLGVSAVKYYNEKALVGDFTICAWGYGHGVLLALLKAQGVNSLVSICKTQPKESLLGCYHGLGHALFQGGVRGLEVAKVCGQYDSKFTDQDPNPINTNSGSCIDGWSMELFTEYNDASSYNKNLSHDQEIRDKELSLCNEIITPERAICESEVFRNYVAKSEELRYMLPRMDEYAVFCEKGVSLHRNDLGFFSYICSYFLGAQIEETFYASRSSFEDISKEVLKICGKDNVCIKGFWVRYKNYNYSAIDTGKYCKSSFLGEICRSEAEILKVKYK